MSCKKISPNLLKKFGDIFWKNSRALNVAVCSSAKSRSHLISHKNGFKENFNYVL